MALPRGERKRFDLIVEHLKPLPLFQKNLLRELIRHYQIDTDRWVGVKEIAKKLQIGEFTSIKNSPTRLRDYAILYQNKSTRTGKPEYKLNPEAFIKKSFPSLVDENEEVWLALVQHLAEELFI